MKSFFTSILILFSYLVFAQSPYQIADSTKEWNTIHGAFGAWGIHYCGGTNTNYFGGEFFFDNLRYLEVLESKDSLQEEWEGIGLLREDTITQRVYYEGGLIYDFDIELGDSIYITNHYIGFAGALMRCDSIDTVNMYGNRKRFYFNAYLDGNYFEDTWIEGIGSIYGLLYSGINAANYAGGFSNLICCSKNDTVIYFDSVYRSCFVDDFYPVIISETYDTAYVGVYYEFQLLVDTMNVDSFSINGAVIPESFSFDEKTFLLTGTPDSIGAFFCAITSSNYDLNYEVDIIEDHIIVVLPTATIEFPEQFDIKIYPNPASQYVNFVFDTNQLNTKPELAVFNSQGQLVFVKIAIETSTIRWDTKTIPNGIYFYKLTSDGKLVHSGKIIVK